MALHSSTNLDTRPDQEAPLLRRLLGLYQEEIQIYGQVLQLSQQQGQMIRMGRSIQEIRRILEKKKNCLDIISRLEATERGAKQEWEQGRLDWSSQGRTRLHEALADVGAIIEEILVTEEENDVQMIAQARTV